MLIQSGRHSSCAHVSSPLLDLPYRPSKYRRMYNVGIFRRLRLTLEQNAKIEGMVTDLGLNGVQWNIVLSVFFVPYILLEVPSNMLLKKFKRPSYYLGVLIVCWGIIMTLMGVVKNFAGLLATRILLGVFE